MRLPSPTTLEPSWHSPHDIGGWVRPLAVLLGGSLDRRLASAHSPESSRLLAARAEHLAAIRVRRALAQDWSRVLQQARMPSLSRRAAARLCRERVLGAEPAVREMLRALVAPLPVPARGVAAVSCLLSDGTGPLYSWSCPIDLTGALRQATAQLDPTTPLAEPLPSGH